VGRRPGTRQGHATPADSARGGDWQTVNIATFAAMLTVCRCSGRRGAGESGWLEQWRAGTVTQADFLEALTAELRLQAARYDLRPLQVLMVGAGRLMEDAPAAGLWAGAFVAGGNATLTA